MSGRSPAGPLIAEHRVIERLIKVLDRELALIAQRGSVDPRFIDRATDFIRTFADRCHHGKEEDILFRRLAEKDIDAELAAQMQELIEDHVMGRALTRRLVDANDRYAAGDHGALNEIVEAMRELVRFYPQHIEKEDTHFFAPCVAQFSDAEMETMLADFEDFERELLHEKYSQVLAELEGGSHEQVLH